MKPVVNVIYGNANSTNNHPLKKNGFSGVGFLKYVDVSWFQPIIS